MVEVIIATLLVAMITAPIMSTVLNSHASSGRVARREAAAQSVRALSENLKPYVTADRAVAPGPGGGFDGWSLPGDAPGRYAFEPGRHELDAARWAPALKPYEGRISYDVRTRTTPSGPLPDVTFNVTWTEPSR